jgi:LysM repeat protein
MNFSSDSVKHESKTQNEDFNFDLETPRGHFFAVIDFDNHDFANLNATLKGKLETIVNSFVSLSRFSADLFLGFLAKEINNFLHNLREQAGGPQLVGSAVFCLLSGNRLHYLLCGNIAIRTWNAGKVTTLAPAADENGLQKLGRSSQESPLTDAVQNSTLDDADVALVMTAGVTSVLDAHSLSSRLDGLSDASAMTDALMSASSSSKDDRTVLVITGPFERYVDPMVFDLTRAVASLESRVDTLAQTQRPPVAEPSTTSEDSLRQLEDRLVAQIATIREDVRGKAGSIDFLELDEKMTAFAALVAGKADKADLLGLQSDLLKLSVASDVPPPPAAIKVDEDPLPVTDNGSQRSLLLKIAGIVLVVGLAGGFLGAWLQSRLMRRPAAATPAPLAVQAPVPTPQPSPSPVATPGVTELVLQPGDSLKKLAQQYNVSERAIMDLNPTIQRWATIQPGQKILVPAASVASPSPSPTTTTATAPGTAEVIVGPGDSINRFAQRYGTTPARIRELNPHITNWNSIQTGQKVLMPTPPSG